MKDFLDDIMDRISDTAEAVGKKAENVVESQKIKSRISGLERNNRRDFREIGRMLYEKYKNEEMVDAEFLELCEAIEERENEIAACEIEIEALKED